jgi:formate dehydrogenase subunit beta
MERNGIPGRIREEASRLLSGGIVDLVIGFENGSLPMRTTPCFVTEPDDAWRLVWNAFCSNNLSLYLTRSDKRVGIVAKGCDTRAIVELIKEHQIGREDVVIIGVPCNGMADPAKIAERCGGMTVVGVEDLGGTLMVAGGPGPIALDREAVLHQSCRVCTRRNPVISDVLVGDELEERADLFEDVDAFASLTPGERWAHITSEMQKCIRCHACRNACPLCCCAECFADSSQPQWVGRGTDPGDVLSFHLIRVLHLAGRCIECGACRRACPMSVDLGTLNRKMSADVMRLFGYRAGLDTEAPAPLSTFDPEDVQDFMLEPGSGRECGGR